MKTRIYGSKYHIIGIFPLSPVALMLYLLIHFIDVCAHSEFISAGALGLFQLLTCLMGTSQNFTLCVLMLG